MTIDKMDNLVQNINNAQSEKDSAMENATLLLLIDSKLDEFKNREMISGAEIVDFLLDLRNAASHSAPHEDVPGELITN